MQELTNSSIARQNILNNTFAVEEIRKAVGIKGVLFEINGIVLAKIWVHLRLFYIIVL
jgi:hypothetical protein